MLSYNGLDWKGLQKSCNSNPPAMSRDNFHTHGMDIGIRVATALSEWNSSRPDNSLYQLQRGAPMPRNSIFTEGNRCFPNTCNRISTCQNWKPNFMALNESGDLAKGLELPC